MSTVKRKYFRHDINGLRAWAVVAVVLYHFGVPGFSGGFIGVDVFFVISGFLMTKIITEGLESNTFSFSKFMLSRAKRILPPLLTLCIGLLIFGWFWLSTIDFQQLGTHIIGAALFISNHRFLGEAGYFDIASNEKWLLHTWSLSVEWQFYVFLPLIMMVVWRCLGVSAVKVSLSIIGGISFLLAVYTVNHYPDHAFYLLPYRAWEMLAGGWVWWATRNKRVRSGVAWIFQVLGFIALIYSITVFDTNTPWPGMFALVPVVGTMFIIAAHKQTSIPTTNVLAQKVGSRSYSIYLWHWPAVVFLHYANQQNSLTWVILGIVFSFVMGGLSYHFIEIVFNRFINKYKVKKQVQVLVALFVVVELLAISTRHLHLDGRLPERVELASNETFNRHPRLRECLQSPGRDIVTDGCLHGDGPLAAVIVGDSHANAVVSSIVEATHGGSVQEFSYNSCPTLLGMHSKENGSECTKFNKLLMAKLAIASQVPVIVVARITGSILGYNEVHKFHNKPTVYFENEHQTTRELLAAYEAQQIETLCKLSENRPVYLVRPFPEMGRDVPTVLYRNQMFLGTQSDYSIPIADYHSRHDAIWQAQDKAAVSCGVTILNPLPYLCHDEKCWGSENGRPFYYDNNHLSEFGNKQLVPMFEQVFNTASAF